MDDDVVRLALIGRIVRRRWRLLVALAAVGALLGFGASLLVSPGYESASKVLLQGPRDEEELLTEAQIAMSQVVLDRTAAALGWITGAELRGSVTATVVEGNVIELSGTAVTPRRSVELTDRATREYVTFSTQIVDDAANAATQVLQDRRATVQRRIDETGARITELQRSPVLGEASDAGAQVRAELDRLGGALNDANAELDDIDGRAAESEAESASNRSAVGVLEPAVLRGPAEPTLGQLTTGGAVLFGLLGVFGLVAAARMDRRLRGTADIAAALGSPVLASVDVAVAPGESPTRSGTDTPKRRIRTRLLNLMRDDVGWDVAGGPARGRGPSEDVRYRRVLTRLRGATDADLRLLVLVPEDDAVARRAVAQLAIAAANAPVSVVTDSAVVTELTRAAAGRAGPHALPVMVRASSAPAPSAARTELRVVEFLADRPTVPECGPVCGVLIVLCAGTRTAWELIGLAGACLDAGHPVLGALVVSPSPAASGADERQAPPPDHPSALSNGTLMAGSA